MAAFRGCGLRHTPQRYVVIEYLTRHPVQATADDIYRAVNRSDRRTSRATVYNSLRALADSAWCGEVHLEGKSARFDVNIERHHHFVCERCGYVEDIRGLIFHVSRSALNWVRVSSGITR